MRTVLLILLTYITLAAEASLLSGAVSSTSSGSSWGASLSPVLILLSFTWLRPLAAGILSAFISLYIEMRYSTPPGAALMLTTFIALLLTQVSIQRYLKSPFIFLLSCFPIVLVYDYTLLLVIELLSPTPATAETVAVPTISLPPILGSIMVALRSCAIVTVVSVIALGFRALLTPPEAETV